MLSTKDNQPASTIKPSRLYSIGKWATIAIGTYDLIIVFWFYLEPLMLMLDDSIVLASIPLGINPESLAKATGILSLLSGIFITFWAWRKYGMSIVLQDNAYKIVDPELKKTIIECEKCGLWWHEESLLPVISYGGKIPGRVTARCPYCKTMLIDGLAKVPLIPEVPNYAKPYAEQFDIKEEEIEEKVESVSVDVVVDNEKKTVAKRGRPKKETSTTALGSQT